MSYILIIDDDEDFSVAVATTLRNVGYEVQVELDIQSAEESMKNRRPDLVILDVMFPEDSSAGFSFARKMRHYDEKLKDIPILMLTAVNSRFPLGFSSTDIDDYWLPVEDFLEKPVDLDILKKKVDNLITRVSK